MRSSESRFLYTPHLFTFILFIVLASALIITCDESPQAPEPPPPPAPVVTCDSLLTDEELLTDPDSLAIPVDAAVSAWIQANNYPIRSLTEECYSDLQFLKSLIGGRRLVQLGESGHGVSEFNTMKVRLIKFLHEEMGFDVIAFESGIFECWRVNNLAVTETAEDLDYASIFPVWQCRETVPLFEYVKETQATGRPLIVAGFDIQMSSLDGVRVRPGFMRNIVSSIDPAYGAEVYDIEFSLISVYTHGWAGRPFSDWVDAYWQTYTTYYNNMVTFFDTHMDTLLEIYADDPVRPRIARQTAWSMPKFLQMVHEWRRSENAPTISTRDAAMAVNVCALMDDIYPDKKIINWAHNYHIRHDYDTMGGPVADAYRPDMYTIGLYMYRGRAAHNDRQVYNISPPTPNSVESVFYRTRRKFCYVDLLHQRQETGNAWMFGPFIAKTWGLFEVEMIMRNQYDGILFIDTVKPPVYLPRRQAAPAYHTGV